MEWPTEGRKLAGTVQNTDHVRSVSNRLAGADIDFRTTGQLPKVQFWVAPANQCYAASLIVAVKSVVPVKSKITFTTERW